MLLVGRSAKLAAQVSSQHCEQTEISWSASPSGIVSVDVDGTVTAIATGEVTISATAHGVAGSVMVKVERLPVVSIRIVPDSLVIAEGGSLALLAEALDEEGQPVPGGSLSWQSSNELAAKVGSDGVIQALTAGESALVSVSRDGITASLPVHVVRRRLAYFRATDSPYHPEQPPLIEYGSYNSAGGDNSVSEIEAGRYIAGFPHQEPHPYEAQAIFLSPVNQSGNWNCNPATGGTATVEIQCTYAWFPEPSSWSAVLIASGTLEGRWGFARITGAGTTPAPADPQHRFNSSGREIEATRVGNGQYLVRFEGLGRPNASAHEGVIVNGFGPVARCYPDNWHTAGADLMVTVQCLNPFNATSDADFTVLVVDGSRPGRQSLVVTTQQADAAEEVPVNSEVYPSGSVMIQKLGTGWYRAEVTGFDVSGGLQGAFLVSPVGGGNCILDTWAGAPGLYTEVLVHCVNQYGHPADNRFSLVGFN